MEKNDIKGGLVRHQSFVRMGTISNRPVFSIMTTTTVTTILPKWFTELVRQKVITFKEIEPAFRELQKKLEKIGLDKKNYSLYESTAFIQNVHIFDGSPKEGQNDLKVSLRLYNKALKEFLEVFKPKVSSLLGYIYRNGRVYYCFKPK